MKVLCIALLVAIVCIQKADSLWCFGCEDQTSNWRCLNLVKCAETDNHCMTTVTIIGEGNNSFYRLNKKCVPMCTENFVNTGLGSVLTKCCRKSRCNAKGR